MQTPGNRRRMPMVALGTLLLTLSIGSGVYALIQLPIDRILDANEVFNVSFEGRPNTGFTIRSVDGSALTLVGDSRYDPEAGL
jgi:hypothetical protein